VANELLESLAEQEGDKVMQNFLKELKKVKNNKLGRMQLTGSRGVTKSLGKYQINKKDDKFEL
jgi:hypothetical protein